MCFTICLLSLSSPHNSPNSAKSCQICHTWKRLYPPPYLIVQWYLPATITLFASSHEICGEMQTPGYIHTSYFWEQDLPTHSHFYHQYWCLSFLADTKSNESMLNLCFTMPVTFYFYKKFCTDSWFENEGHALTFWQKYCFGSLLSAQKVYSREQDLARNST